VGWTVADNRIGPVVVVASARLPGPAVSRCVLWLGIRRGDPLISMEELKAGCGPGARVAKVGYNAAEGHAARPASRVGAQRRLFRENGGSGFCCVLIKFNVRLETYLRSPLAWQGSMGGRVAGPRPSR
jgi:hypothetical protein